MLEKKVFTPGQSAQKFKKLFNKKVNVNAMTSVPKKRSWLETLKSLI